MGRITSRIGHSRDAIAVSDESNVFDLVADKLPCNCVLIDEGQFLSRDHVLQLCQIVDELNIPVKFIGFGEGMEDLRPFNARSFVDALFDGDKEGMIG